ncbi:Ig-like domain-containing protein [Marmoricola sp. URHB0036]|uniref:fibronectin type III domain-containing protein n=1 Tax=Marmoricola sp. URHB0036 TaxID=1298863 RepID=UPI000418F0E3|nr:Ig-like domain-containing protein [Marmoricola sp. URHB0036]
MLASALVLSATAAPPSPARAADPTCTISAKLVNSCRPWLGAESGGYGPTGLRASMLAHEASIGRQLDIVHEYLGTGNITLTSDIVTLAKRANTIALVNWRVVSKWASGDGRTASVNTQIDNMANSIKALGTTKIMLTVSHEPENDISPGGGPACTTYSGGSGTTADYVNMWHNVRARFDALGVTNVVWVMNFMGYEGWNCVENAVWPGNDYVDWVMWDPYPRNSTWAYHVGGFYNWLTTHSDAEHNYLSKPWGLAEFGNIGTSQANVYQMYDDAKRGVDNNTYPRLKAYVVWDQHTSSSSDVRIGYDHYSVSDPVELQHYNAFANDPLLTGTGVPDPVDTTSPTVVSTAPDDAATVSGTVDVTGSATDDVGVTSVNLLVDGQSVATTAPLTDGSVSVSWNSASLPNGSHTLQLRARDAAGNIGLSAVATVTVQNVDDEAPTPPGNLTAVWGKPSQVTLAWSAATDNAAVTGYRVYRDGVTTPLATVPATARGYVDPGIANLSNHHYTVTAVDAAGHESDPSNEAVVDAGDDTPPGKPTASASLTGPAQATVTWTDVVDNVGVTGYRVYRGSSLVGTVTDGSDTLVEDGLDDGVTYYYRVIAYDAAANTSTPSDPVAVTTPDVTAPTTPVNLKAVSAPTSVALTWSAATDNVGVANYVVYRDGLPQATLNGTTTSWTDTAPVGTTLHRYRVMARDAAGNASGLSNEVARSLADTTPPTAPTRLTGSLSGGTVRLTWTASTDAVGVTGYTIYRGGVSIGTSTTPSYTDSTPPPGRASNYTVRARDAAGNTSAASTAVSVTVPADKTAPSAPGSLRLTIGATGTRQITLSWTAATDNVGVASYYVYRGNSKYRLLGNVTSFADTGLTAGTKYTYKVYAIDAAGNWSSPTASVSGTAR